MAAKKSTLGKKIDQLFELREQKRIHESAITKIVKAYDLLETELMEQMEAEGVSKSTGLCASASVTESVKPTVENWDLFYAFIAKNKYYHLLERRPSVTGCRELFETKGKIPGVVPFTQRKLNLRTTNDA